MILTPILHTNSQEKEPILWGTQQVGIIIYLKLQKIQKVPFLSYSSVTLDTLPVY